MEAEVKVYCLWEETNAHEPDQLIAVCTTEEKAQDLMGKQSAKCSIQEVVTDLFIPIDELR